MSDAVIVFIRFPQKGKVKTRLAKTLGDDFAVSFYKTCAEHTLAECRKISSEQVIIYISCTDENDLGLIKEWAGSDFRFIVQKGGNIGVRMLNAFKDVLNDDIDQAILIGTDIPDISSGILTDALTLLIKNEVVIGPAKDSGYYLLGMKKIYEFLFEEINWETDGVYTETLRRLNEYNIRPGIVKLLYDIDTEENLNEWMDIKDSVGNSPVKDFVRQYFS